MKRQKSLFGTLAMLLCSITVNAHDFTVGGIYYNITSAKELTVEVTYKGSYNSEYMEYGKEVVIPETVEYKDKIYSVTRIGKDAFANCKELEDITIPNSVVGIGNLAFYATPWYDNQPDGLVYAGKVVYEYKGSMAEGAIVKLKEGTLGIADFAFANISSSFSVDMPNSIENIGKYAFYNCPGLPSLSLPENLREIGECVFSGCSSLKSVVIHDSITSIGNEAFRYCSGLGSVTIGNGVKTIGEYAFDGCFLKSMTVGTGVIKIGAWQTMPYKTIWLTETPPNGYVNLKGTRNYVPNRQYGNIVDKKIYNNLKSLFEVDGVIYVPDNSGEAVCDVINCRYDSVITSVVIGDSVVYNGKAMAVKDINPYSFYFLDSLNSVRVNNKGRIYDYAFVTGSITDVIVGDSVKTIDNAVFNGCYYMKTITLGSNLIRLGNYALAGCEQLEEIKCNAITPPTCGTDALFGINKSKCKLVVPQGCLAAYKAANQWKEFVNISENKQNTGISGVKDKSLDVKSNGGTITVTGADDGTKVEVYGISGARLGEAKTVLNTATISIGQHADNIVIVKVGNKAVKIRN